MRRKKTILLVVLLMAVGFAAVSTTLYINGQTKINANQDDFNVYYSDAYVNGVQDLSVVTDDTHISFTTELSTLGEKYVLDYEVTNGSKNYDAELVMECSEGNDYLSVTNEFDDESILESLQTRSGKLTLELTQSYAGEEDMDVTITCTINANAIERNTLGEGNVAEPVRPLAKWVYTDLDNSGDISVGDVYTLNEESFNVVSQTDETVTLLASNVLGTDYRQTESTNKSEYGVIFASTNGWEYTPAPKEIDIQTWSTNPKIYVNEYVTYLQSETGSSSITGDLITLAELEKLGCTVPSDYSNVSDKNARTCANSEHASWLANGQNWWIRSAGTDVNDRVWSMVDSGTLVSLYCISTTRGVRPVITISKSALR